MSFKKGDTVIQILQAPIEGTVAGFSLDQDTGEVKVLVAYKDANGDSHQRYFKASELNEVVAPTTTA